MQVRSAGFIKFDRQFPMYNFFFPAQGATAGQVNLADVYATTTPVRHRALYFHIPFCETICSFCPFTRGKYHSKAEIDRYVDALLGEVKLKAAQIDLGAVPIRAIFFGGGTPSLLSPEHILRIGEAIHAEFDLSDLNEFSFEVEAKSFSEEKARALRTIGVTHPRFGLQTFNMKWRNIFHLTATLEQIYTTAELAIQYFPFQSFDLLYGMNGQDEGEIVEDLERAVALGTTNIDIYPIDNVMTQVTLHREIEKLNTPRTSATRKFTMNLLVDQAMRHSGFMPHNGHGYYRCTTDDAVVTDKYSFVYHESVYGYQTHDLMGFGTNAISSTFGHVLTNERNREKYARAIASGAIPQHCSRHDTALDFARPLVLRLPYHGVAEKAHMLLDEVPSECIARLRQLEDEGLIEQGRDKFSLTKLGWYWYVNVMYFLMPKPDQQVQNRIIHAQLKDKGRRIVPSEVRYLDVA